MTTVKVSSRNQIVIPKQARERLDIAPGDQLLVIERRDGMLLVAKPQDLVASLRGSGSDAYGDVDKYLKKERRSW